MSSSAIWRRESLDFTIVGRVQNIPVLYSGFTCLLHILELATVPCFLTRLDHSGVFNCFPTVMSYRDDIPGAKKRS